MWAKLLGAGLMSTSLFIQLSVDGAENLEASSQRLGQGSRSGQCLFTIGSVQHFLSTRYRPVASFTV